MGGGGVFGGESYCFESLGCKLRDIGFKKRVKKIVLAC